MHLPTILERIFIFIFIILETIWLSEEFSFDENSIDSLTSNLKSHVFLDDRTHKYNTSTSADNTSLSRGKRQTMIAFPNGELIQSILVSDYYIILPAPHFYGTFAPVALQIKFTHRFPNITWSKAKSFEDRIDLYGTVESFFNHFGLHGRSCMLRAICERNEYHVLVDGIVGEAINLLLEFSSPSSDINFSDYVEAREHGRYEGDCATKYGRCPLSIFKQ